MKACAPEVHEASHATKGLLRLTMACNEVCAFCNVPVEDYPQPTPPFEKVLEQLDAFVQRGEKTLTISGGEPTLLKKRLLTLIQAARQKGVSFIELQTNAILIDESYAQKLQEAGLTSAFVSLLSHVPEDHDFLTGLDGSFQRCVAGIQALIAVGIESTLNPVVTHRTQTKMEAYVHYVAEHLPGVRTISLSAVQPHGRAQSHLDLMPDYAVLAQEVPKILRVAEAAGIKVVNPYCGLPLCVGWSDQMNHSIEAEEANRIQLDGPIGLDNRGNKSHGAACHRCLYRPRCGGAWHAYWNVRDGSGIAPPDKHVPPWLQGADEKAGQTIVALGQIWDEAQLLRLREATTPTVWADLYSLHPNQMKVLFTTRVTDIALRFSARGLAAGDPSVIERVSQLRRVLKILRLQHKVQLHLFLYDPGTSDDRLAYAHLVDRLQMSASPASNHDSTQKVRGTLGV